LPIADARIASFVKLGIADYVATDDSHYRTLESDKVALANAGRVLASCD
jgi:hypothetical protein